uniref:Uncharacterized protein n=1 Tax=viral metagenome TaxID=1070528 RepID=A0A6M3L983_9ZZZZ
MGTNKIDANVQGKVGTETITNFATIGDASAALVGATITGAIAGTTVTGTTITGTGAVSGANVRATNYVRVGTNRFLFASGLNTQASMVAAATALAGTASIKGSLMLGNGRVWYFVSDTSASPINLD